MLLNTQYTLHKDGVALKINIMYEHFEAIEGFRNEELEVVLTNPNIDFSEDEREQIELACWDDQVKRKDQEYLKEVSSFWVPEQTRQEIPQCRKHFF